MLLGSGEALDASRGFLHLIIDSIAWGEDVLLTRAGAIPPQAADRIRRIARDINSRQAHRQFCQQI